MESERRVKFNLLIDEDFRKIQVLNFQQMLLLPFSLNFFMFYR